MIEGLELPSSDGRCSIVGKVVDTTELKVGICYLMRMSGSGMFWRRGSALTGEELQDFAFELPQVFVARDSLRTIRSELLSWLSSPGEIKLEFGKLEGQSLAFALGHVEGWICSRERPVCVFAYSSLRFSMTASFCLDQSCVRVCTESLAWTD